MTKLLSIITVTFNSAKTLQRTIDSIRSQLSPEIEYIIIDGGSKDGTVDIIKKNADIVDVWISEKDKGIYDAMNKGLFRSSGKYVSYMNSDDWYESGVLPKCLPTLRDSRATIIYGDTTLWSENGSLIGTRPSDQTCIGRVPRRMPFSHQSCFILGAAMKDLGGFNTSYKVVADFDMVTALILRGGIEVEKLPFPISAFSIGGASSNIVMSANERFKIHLKYGLNIFVAFMLYLNWLSIALIKHLAPPQVELALRKFKTRNRL